MKKLIGLVAAMAIVSGCNRQANVEQIDQPALYQFSQATRPGASTLSDEARLRKLSLHLRGFPPSEADFKALSDAKKSGKLPEYWKMATTSYLSSHEHVAKMMTRLDELFRMRTSAGLIETRWYLPSAPAMTLPGSETLNGMDTLFENVVRQNLSWDTIATAKNYKIPNPNFGFDFYFLVVATPLPIKLGTNDPLHYFDVNFPANDARIAGAVTTGRFFGRYSTTNVNKNRGRAAAIFRTFLCDDMKAVVTPSAEEEKELVENGFPLPDSREVTHFTDDDEAKHGSSPACMTCHYKLDPMGRHFINIGNALPNDPAPGRLTFKRADGTLVDIGGAGLGEIMQFVTQQPEYASCQVSHFWKWFIRGDELPSAARLQELVKEFDRVGRKPNDFIAYLVNQPEFLKTAEALNPSVTLLQVSPILQRCDTCHSGQVTSTSPPFTKLPIGGDSASHQKWLTDIVAKLDLVHDGKDKTMPPSNSAWQPTAEELLLVKRWIYEGAKGDDGAITIDPQIAQTLILENSPVAEVTPRMEYRDSYVRYLRTHDIFRHLINKFRKAKREGQCATLTPENRPVLGDANPFDGELSFRTPSPAFIRWWGKCLSQAIVSDVSETLTEDKTMAGYYGADAAQELKAANLPKALTAPKEVLWNAVPVTTQAKMIEHIVEQMLGSHLVADQSALVAQLQKTLADKGATLNVLDAVQKTFFYLGSSDVFLVY